MALERFRAGSRPQAKLASGLDPASFSSTVSTKSIAACQPTSYPTTQAVSSSSNDSGVDVAATVDGSAAVGPA